MNIGKIRIGFIGHTSFLFGAPDGTTLLTDPYFCGGFELQGVMERHLQQPDIRPDSISSCAAIFVSHIHGDHCDFAAIESICRRTSARILAPAETLEHNALRGLPAAALVPLEDGLKLKIGSFDVEALGGYDRSFDAQGRMNKFSMLAKHDDSQLWYSGDCHALPPGLAGRTLDAVFCWSSPDVLSRLSGLSPRPKRFVMMHHDRHEPGNFWCSRNAEREADVIARMLPDTEVIVPDRLGSFAGLAAGIAGRSSSRETGRKQPPRGQAVN